MEFKKLLTILILGLMSFSLVTAYGGGGGSGVFSKPVTVENKIGVLTFKMFNGTVLTAECKEGVISLSNGKTIPEMDCSKFNATKYSSYGEGYLTLYQKKKELKSEPSVFVKVEPVINVTNETKANESLELSINETALVIAEEVKTEVKISLWSKVKYVFSFKWLWDWA